MSTHRSTARQAEPRRESGQILVMFVLVVFVIIGVIGLVLDGGSAFAQRRNEQNVADLSAIAGATAYLNTQGGTAAKRNAADAAAITVAAANGYTPGANGTTLDVQVTPGFGSADVRVNLASPHRNNFAALMGMPTWTVSVTATAQSSEAPNAAIGLMPLLFNEVAFNGAACDEAEGGCVSSVFQLPGTGTEDVPQDATQFNWTVFCTANGDPDQDPLTGNCNGNSSSVEALIEGNGDSTVVELSDDIGPLNAGAHTTLFNALSAYAPGIFPVPIVCTISNDPTCPADGAMVGFAYFKILSVEGASEKVIRGYFVSPVNASQLVVSPGGGQASVDPQYFIKLIN